MDVFYKLDIDPSHVIGLYSDLLPSEFINQVFYVHHVRPNLTDAIIPFVLVCNNKVNTSHGKNLYFRLLVCRKISETEK